MTALGFAASVGVWVVFSAATWDEEDWWRRVALIIAMAFALAFLGVVRYNQGYEDGVCDTFKIINATDEATVRNLPDYC